jgi:hypothetical protein
MPPLNRTICPLFRPRPAFERAIDAPSRWGASRPTAITTVRPLSACCAPPQRVGPAGRDYPFGYGPNHPDSGVRRMDQGLP